MHFPLLILDPRVCVCDSGICIALSYDCYTSFFFENSEMMIKLCSLVATK